MTHVYAALRDFQQCGLAHCQDDLWTLTETAVVLRAHAYPALPPPRKDIDYSKGQLSAGASVVGSK